jgi:hypothetical protein
MNKGIVYVAYGEKAQVIVIQSGKLCTYTGFFVKRFRIRGWHNEDSLDFILGWFCVSIVYRKWINIGE